MTPDPFHHRRRGAVLVAAAMLAFLVGLAVGPTAVEAAQRVQKVVIADAKNAKRTATVDKTGRLKTVVSGKVATPPNRPAPPLSPFHRERIVGGTAQTPLGGPVPRGRSVAITSLNVVATSSGSGWSQIFWRKAVGGTCSQSGATLQRVADFRLDSAMSGANSNFTQTFPVPQIQGATDAPLCLWVLAAPNLTIIVDGYTY